MKTTFRFRILFHILNCLLLSTACSDDTLPAITEPETEQPTASPDALHDKTREKPYPKADNELYINPAPFIVPQAMKTGDKLQFAFSQSKDFLIREPPYLLRNNGVCIIRTKPSKPVYGTGVSVL